MIKKPLVFRCDKCIHNVLRNIPIGNVASVFQEVFTHEGTISSVNFRRGEDGWIFQFCQGRQTAKYTKAYEKDHQHDQAQADKKKTLQSILTAFDMAKTIDMRCKQ